MHLYDQLPVSPRSTVNATQSIRVLINALVTLPENGELPEEACNHLEAAAKIIQSKATVTANPRSPELSIGTYLDRSPVTGLANPIAPPLEMKVTENGVYSASVRMGHQYQGPPSRVHGGFIAVLLDHVMGMAASAPNDIDGALTRSLTLEYLSATPLNTNLEVRGWIKERDGRKIWMEGEIVANGKTTVRAHGLWIAISSHG